ncbi:hypothetical protein BC830DRAFT_1170218 [Chytriomyces sp. MP71]|nr:hypothetical protein BC830DRAFT_1170218 [Chytriomyces sp. MP71]
MSITGVPLSCFIYGICAEASFRGMIQSGPELLSHLRGEEPGSAILIATVFIFNMLAFANTAVFIPLLNLNENDCASLNTAGLVTWHAFFIIFDGFVMFKSYVCVRRNLYFKIICIIALLYRIGWTIADLMFTGGTWDSENQACVYAANFQTGLHYTIADIICDALSTVAAVYMMIQNREGLKGITSVFKEVMSENG